MLTIEDRKYLNNKNRGGISNSKGNSYENLYAVYKIALLLKHYPNNDGTSLTAQVKDAFVDDLFISHNSGTLDFYQLKNVASLTWLSGASHTLEYDFIRQKELMEAEGRTFSLFLIYSNSECDLTPIPIAISDCTQIFHFPYFPSLNRLLLESPEFKNAIEEISAISSPQNDKLLTLATILLGFWESTEKNNVSLTNIVQAIREINITGNNFIFDELIQIDLEAIHIYNKIPNFKWINSGSTFYWTYKENMKGEMLKSSYFEFEKAVLKNKPADYYELESLM